MTDWTWEWPDRPGWYWFYGWPWGNKRGQTPRLYMVQVHRGANSLVAHTQNSFVYSSEAEGVWTKADVPEPPTMLTLEDNNA